MSITIQLSSQYPHDIDGLLWHGSRDILWVLSPGLEGHSHFQSQKTVGQLRNNTRLEKNMFFRSFAWKFTQKKRGLEKHKT